MPEARIDRQRPWKLQRRQGFASNLTQMSSLQSSERNNFCFAFTLNHISSNFCYFKPRCLWQFVMAAQGNEYL